MSDPVRVGEFREHYERVKQLLASCALGPAEHESVEVVLQALLTMTRDHARIESQLTEAQQRIQLALRLAKEATNGWACYATRKLEVDEIARLHKEIDDLEACLLTPPDAES
jgi:hypothetical protein